MRRLNDVTYEVENGERITIDVVPTNFLSSLPSVESVLDGKDLENSGTVDAPRFSFTVTRASKDIHRVLMEFNFIPGTPNNACYGVTIKGRNDVGCPCGFEICKTDDTREVGILFVVS
jgi:hypothetical protein